MHTLSRWSYLGLSGLLLLTSCARYVNIPAVEGDVALHDPNHKEVQTVMVLGAKAVVADWPADQSFQVALPKGTLPVTYDLVLPRISPQATWAAAGPQEGLPLIDVRQVRIRSPYAEVDVIRPVSRDDDQGGRLVVTAQLKWDMFTGWRMVEVRPWRMSVEQALRTTSFRPLGAETWPRNNPPAPAAVPNPATRSKP